MIGKARSVKYLLEIQKSPLPWLTFTIHVCSKKCVQCDRKFRKCNVIFYLRIICQIRSRIVYLVIRVAYIIASRLIWPYSILHNEGSHPDLHNKRRNDNLMTSYWARRDLMTTLTQRCWSSPPPCWRSPPPTRAATAPPSFPTSPAGSPLPRASQHKG